MPEVKSHPQLGATVDQSTADLERAQFLSQPVRPPAQVEGYDIQRCLGAGAFGTVWLATQKSTGKVVAIKFYEHRGGLDWALLNREVEKLALLYTDHDVVQLIDVGWDASPPYYVMEYLERGSLEQLLSRGPLPVSEAVRIVREVAQALVHAHGRGILHCDLKPANVLLDNDWKVRLADFGQSRLSYEQLPALGCTRWAPCCITC
ncbi:MAG: serine/threonine protein kinase [Planctomycetes bacterium]|nr:serine/threonine protein kinase [Planctomycetota bacterium]